MSWASNRPSSNAGGGGSGGPVAIGDISDWPVGVSATEVGYLDGATSNLQTQIDGKAATSHTHAATDLASGQVALARGGTGSDLSATGGSGHYLKQASAGAAVTVGAIAAGDLPTGIDAAKIADGSVSNAEFQRLNGVTSDIQTQLDSKASAAQLAIFRRATSDQTSISGSFVVDYLEYNSEILNEGSHWTRSGEDYTCNTTGTYILTQRIYSPAGAAFLALELDGAIVPAVYEYASVAYTVATWVFQATAAQVLKFHIQSSGAWSMPYTDGASRVGINQVSILKVA